MFDTQMDDLDAAGTLAAAEEARAIVERGEVRLLEVAMHWADLHGHLEDAGNGVALPGCERLVLLGGAGTPEVADFAPAELGAVLAMSPSAAAVLIGDALDLRHRLPKLWTRVVAGGVKPWIGRKTAQATRHCSPEIVAVVDRRVAPWAHALSWGRLEAIIDAVVIDADSEAAALAVQQAEASQGVWLRPSNDHGIKDIYIRTQAPAAIWFDASIDRVADGLGALGDTSSKDVRRARAVGILAQPQALDLYDEVAAGCLPGRLGAGGLAAPSKSEAKAQEPAASRPSVDGVDAAEDVGGGLGAVGLAAPSKSEAKAQEPAGSSRPRVDTRPPATLYVHMSEDSFTRDDGTGVARFEGVGPITIDQAKKFLRDCQVTIKPVIDLANQTPVDAYEVPDRLRDAVHLRSPVDVFPYATSTGRSKDIDHTIPYVPPDEDGPPGQTAIENLGGMVRFHHRIKTYGRWQVVQVFNGVFVWRSPHGRYFLVDHTGTQPAHKAA